MRARVVLALLLVLTVVSPLAAASTQTDRLSTTIPLNSDQSLSEYEAKGAVTTGVGAPQLTLTMATERKDVGLDWTANPLQGDTRNDFLRIEYAEDIPRTIAVPIRADYVHPFPREDLESLDGKHTADLTPIRVDGTQYLLVTVQFDGAGEAVFPFPEDAQAVYKAADRTDERTNSTFGFSLGLSSTPWEYLNSTAFSGNASTVRLEGEPEKMLIQYNHGTGSDPLWLTVPEGEKRGAPVYRMERDGVDGAVYLVSTTNETPEIRYKHEATVMDRVGAWVADARSIPIRIQEAFAGLWGGE